MNAESRVVLVINSGSSSLKYQLVNPDSGASRAVGIVEQIGEQSSSAQLDAGKHHVDTPHVAVFDTAFFHNLPPAAATYAIDRGLAEKWQIRRYGFHGTSHQCVSDANGVTLFSSLLDEIVAGGASDAGCSITGRGRRPGDDIHPQLPNNNYGNVYRSLRCFSRVLYECLDGREEYSCERETQAAKYQTRPR